MRADYRIVEEIQVAVNVELADAWVEETDSLPFQKYLKTTIDQEDPGLDSRVKKWLESYRLWLPHNSDDAAEKPLKSEPDISIFGSGPSATKGTTLSPQPSYSEVASLWEKGQVAVYAREVFIQQPDRRFVYVPIMTGERIDYHTDAAFFVKLVILLSSFTEELLGFDTSIYWSHGRRFMKLNPGEIFNDTTSCWEPNTEELVFELADEPVFSRRTIRSRGTMFTFDDDRKSIKAERGFMPAEVMMSDRQSKAVVVNRPNVLSKDKHSFFYRTLRQSLSRFTGPERPTLVAFINELRDFFKIRMDSIDRALASTAPLRSRGRIRSLSQIIDAAIENLSEVPSVPVAPLSPVHPSPRAKRTRDAAEDDPEVRPARKKANCNSPSDRAPSAEGSRSKSTFSEPNYEE
ncbi:hypothetical protein C8R44DRAFT_739215 [Mycena epipterygia]|nr:hypothetical protein C8R44DRAFT_739215 [Mycena epipterygia]